MTEKRINTYEELLEFLNIENPEEFEYFENFADLAESIAPIEEGAVFRLFSNCDREKVGELIEGYFDEMMDGIPENEYDMQLLMENIKMTLKGLITTCQEEEDFLKFTTELLRFREWFSCERNTINEDAEAEELISVCHAIAESRLAKLDGGVCNIDFTPCLEYELDDYAVDVVALSKMLEDE